MIGKTKKHYQKFLATTIAIATIVSLVFYSVPQPAEAATYTFQQTNWAGGASTSTATHPGDQTSWNKYASGGATNGLVGYWPLEEGSGTSTADLSGNGNTGTLAASPATPTWTTAGKIGNALSFDGSDDYVNVPDNSSLKPTSAITYAMWVYPRLASTFGVFFEKGDSTTAGYGAFVTSDNKFCFIVKTTTGTYAVGNSTALYQVNQWQHVAVTYDSSGAKNIYVNGVNQTLTSSANCALTNGSGDISQSTAALIFGARTANQYFFNGSIDEVRVYNRALAATEVAELYGGISAINSGADLRIATSTASSTTQTDDGTTNTGFNLAGNSKSSTYVQGTSTAANVQLSTTTIGWYTTTLDSTGDVGYTPVLAIGSDGFARIAYGDATNTTLKFIQCTNASCSTMNVSTIDSGVSLGVINHQIALVLGNDGFGRIVYGSPTIKFAQCGNASCSTATTTVIHTAPANDWASFAIALGSDGFARFTFSDPGGQNNPLIFYQCTNDSCSTKASSTIANSVGRDSAIAMASDGFARILNSYWYQCNNANCSSVTTSTIPSTALYSSPLYHALVLGSDDFGRVTFYNAGDGNSYFFQCTNASCSTTTSAKRIDLAYPQNSSYLSFALDSAGFGRISYYATSTTRVLKFAQCADASCSSYASTTVDSSSAETGLYTSIKLGTGANLDLARIAYYDKTNGNLKYAYQALNYPSTGTFTSGPINVGNSAGLWGNLSWSATTTAQTSVTIKARSATNSSMTGATDWASCSNITNGAALSTGGCVTNGNNHQYIQYQATLSTTDATQTPSLNDITINYQFYGTSGVLTSSAYDSNDAANLIGTLAWDEDTTSPSNTTSTLSLRTASSSSNLALMSWTDFTVNTSGCSKASGTVTCGSSAIPSSMKTGADDQWFQYKITLASSNTGNTPTIAEVRVQYVVNAPPQFNPSYGTGGVSVAQNSSSTDSNWGKVQITYQVLDPDTTSGTATPNNVSSSFEYNIGGSWTAVSPTNLAAGDTNNKTVSPDTYTQYTATWDAKTQIPNTYYATAQVRQTVNDHEAANNTAIATSSAFILDTKNPSSTMTLNGASSTFTYTLTDDSNISFTLSNNSNLSADGLNASSGILQTLSVTSTSATVNWTLATSSYPTVYLNVRDIYGNNVTGTAVAPTLPSSMDIKDVSNVTTNSYSNFISWGVYSSGANATFSNYRVFRSTNGGSTYSLLTTITDVNTNYYRDASLSSSTTYYYKTTITDTDNDVSSFSSSVNHQPVGSGGTDLTPPAITNVTVTSTQATWARITWTTDELATPEINYSASSTAYNLTASTTSYLTSHDITLSGLTPNTVYYFRVRSTDIEGNRGTNDNGGSGFTFTTTGGPIISDVTTESVTDNSATIIWNTNVAANSAVVYAQNITALRTGAGISEVSSSSPVTGPPYQHRITITGLTSRTTYYYYPKVTASSDTTTDSNSGNYYSFRTAYDTKPPVITNVTTTVVTKNSAVITWVTDELSSSQADYGLAAGSYTNATTIDSLLSITHSATIIGLARTTTYYFRVRSIDAANNEAISPEANFRTTEADTIIISTGGAGGAPPPPPRDTTPPKISDIQAVDISAFGATVKFETNESALAIMDYGETNIYGFAAASRDFLTGHAIKLSGLKLGTDYHFKIKAIDKDNNSATSEDNTFRTKFFAESVAELKTVENAYQFQQEVEESIESILPSIIPPFIEKPRVVDIAENSATVLWKTNVKAFSVVAYAPEDEYEKDPVKPYTAEAANIERKVQEHEVKLAGLKSNTLYHYQAKAFSLPQALSKTPDSTFLTKTAKTQPRVADVDKDAIRIVWRTDETASSIVEYKNLRTGEINRKINEEKVSDHDARIENLSPDTTYQISVSGYNVKDNLIEGGEPITVKTSKDVTPPVISSIKIDNALVPGRTDRVQTVVGWKTNEPATSVVFYEEGTSGKKGTALANKIEIPNQLVTDHNVILTELRPGILYRVQLTSVDEAGNKITSPVRTIITPQQAQSIVDVIVKNFEDTFKFLKEIR
ncbi:fibronectin type III domain-containing protein [Candidatus Wolfebacteria bacterium]|nr:fibronectin type III domain-containing protein [Candidatus Wolfebacteria bacterium]